MKTRMSAVSIASLICFGAIQTVNSNACKTLKDSDSPLAISIATNYYQITTDELDDVPLGDIFGEFHDALPWLSTCLASIDPQTVYDSLVSSGSYCLSAVQDLNFDEFNSVDEAMTNLVCPFIDTTGIQCVKKVLNEVMDKLSQTNGCCDAFRAKIVELFSDPLPDMVNKLVLFGANIGCSSRKFSNLKGQSKTETCFTSIYNSLADFDNENITDFAQIPNDGECSAFKGLPFVNTKGTSSRFPFNDKTDSLGICLQPVDNLVKHFRSWPFFQQIFDAGAEGQFSLADLFSTGTYVRGDLFVEWAIKGSNLPMIIARTLDKFAAETSDSDVSLWDEDVEVAATATEVGSVLKSYLRAFALHLPNSANCNYPGQTIQIPYSVSSTASTKPVVTPTPTKSPEVCKSLVDKDSKLFRSLSLLFGFNQTTVDSLSFLDVFGEFDSAFPWFSTCLASSDILTVLTALQTSSSIKSCVSLINDEFNVESSNTLEEVICPMFERTIIPCLHDVMTELMFILHTSNGCCNSLQKKIEELFLDPFPEVINKIAYHAANISCSHRDFTSLNGEATTETCLYSIINSFDDFSYPEGLLNLTMIPNAGMCSAFEGQSFTNTKGVATQFPFNTKSDSMGVCLLPVSNSINYMKSWQFFKQTLDAGENAGKSDSILLSDLFTSGRSIEGDLFIAWALQPSNLPKIIARTIDNFVGAIEVDDYLSWDDSVESLLDDLSDYADGASEYLSHIPSGSCSFSNQKLTPFVSAIPILMTPSTNAPEITTSAPTTTTTNSPTPSITKTSATTQSANAVSTVHPGSILVNAVLSLLLLGAWTL